MVSPESVIRYGVNVAKNYNLEYYEIRYQSVYSEDIIISNGKSPKVYRNIDAGIGIRVIHEGGVGFSSTNILTRAYIERAIKDATENARLNSRKVSLKTAPYEESDKSISYFISERIKYIDIPIDERIAFLLDLARSVESYINAVRIYEVKIKYTREEKLVENSDGISVYSRIPRTLNGFDNGRILTRTYSIGGSGGFEIIKESNINDVLNNDVKALSNYIERAEKIPTSELDLIFSSEVVKALIYEIGRSLEADRILRIKPSKDDRSLFTSSSLGEKIGNSEIHISDDPTIPSSYGFYLYDDECVKARKHELIKEGYVNEFLHSRLTASLMQGASSNGASRAYSFNVEPSTTISNIYLEAGDYNFDELIEDIVYGVYAKSLFDWMVLNRGTAIRLNILEAYLIENGSITTPIKNLTIEIPIYDMLSKIDARGMDIKLYPVCKHKIPSSSGGPSVRIRNIKVFGGV